MRKSLKRKLISSIGAAVALTFTTISTTYAWFVSNTEAWVTNIGLDVTSGSGIYVSVDGSHYTQTLTEEQIQSAIIVKCASDSKARYSFNTNGQLVKQDLSDGSSSLVNSDEIKALFKKIQLSPVTSMDGVNFTDGYIDGDPSDVKLNEGKVVQFDLYFTSNYSGTSDSHAVDVYFNTSEALKDQSGNAIPPTKIDSTEKHSAAIGKVSYEPNEFRLLAGLQSYNHTTGVGKLYASNSTSLVLKTANAMRFSTQVYDNDEGTTMTKIYEPNLGLGSYATNLDSEAYQALGSEYYLKASAYDSTKNAAFTYTNNMRGEGAEMSALDYNEIPFTYQNFDCEEASLVCSVKGANSSVKVTFSFWIEGWDADCFDGIIGDSMDVTLSFTSNYPSITNTKKIIYRNRSEEASYVYFGSKNPTLYIPKTVKGKVFKGWYYNGELYDFTDYSKFSTSEDNTLIAKYE